MPGEAKFKSLSKKNEMIGRTSETVCLPQA
jgi:hypothetical protein